MSGYAESTAIEGTNVGLMIVTKHCQDYFSSLFYKTMIRISIVGDNAMTSFR